VRRLSGALFFEDQNMINMLCRAWLKFQERGYQKTIAECDGALSMPGINPNAASALMCSKISAQVELFKVQAKVNGLRENDGADYAILVALLVMLAWGFVNEMDYRDLTSGSTTCIYRGR
jgi:hypothetical protein